MIELGKEAIEIDDVPTFNDYLEKSLVPDRKYGSKFYVSRLYDTITIEKSVSENTPLVRSCGECENNANIVYGIIYNI